MAAVGVDTNISQPMVSQAKSSSGFFDASVKNFVGGLNVPVYPDFKRLNPVTKPVQAVDNFLFYGIAAAAGVGVVWLLRG